MNEERIKCPYCYELILKEAIKCRFCGEWFTENNKPDVNSDLRVSQPSQDTQDDQSEPELKEAVRESQEELVESPVERSMPVLSPPKRRIAWLRIILTIVYIGIIIAFVVYERHAHEVLNRGRELENLQKYQEAKEKYTEITEGYQLSFAEIDARKGLYRIEDHPDNELMMDNFYWLPLTTWPVCSVLLFLVFLTRLLRPGMACLAFLLLLLGLFGSVLQLTWCGLISSEPINGIVRGFDSEPVWVFIMSYILLIVTAMMTLTATKKAPFGHRIISAKRMGH